MVSTPTTAGTASPTSKDDGDTFHTESPPDSVKKATMDNNNNNKEDDLAPATFQEQTTKPLPKGVSADDWNSSIRHIVDMNEVKFDTTTLPADMQRVYKVLAKDYGIDYALHTIFVMRTAIELHRAWHMTLLTHKIMQQLKSHFRLRMNWTLGVFKLAFRFQDGDFELHRRVPYDYDSEYQDIYMRIAIALLDEDITVHEALVFQSQTKQGKHTASSGTFLRQFPGRLVLYPFVAATCAVIFFNGDWTDFGIAALTGLVSGLLEYFLSSVGAGIFTDVLVGASVGVVGGLFYRFGGQDICLSSIFLGTLYWYFYGTAFVLGILEIIAGELEVGVTRFIAVSVKTFVLCLGASIGLLAVGDASKVWSEQDQNCGRIDLNAQWWRIPLYLACSVAVLGQYRAPIVRYWRALIVMLVGYEVQFQMFHYFAQINDRDNLDTATSNIIGCAAAVVAACGVSFLVNMLRYHYDGHILSPDETEHYPLHGKIIYHTMSWGVKLASYVGLGRKSDRLKLKLEKKLAQAKREVKDRSNSRENVHLQPEEENLIIELIVGSQDMNVWSILMPALYQMVPGSLIAKLWFNYVFPPPLVETIHEFPGTDQTFSTFAIDAESNNVFSGLMVVSTSLALGLIFGFATVQLLECFFDLFDRTDPDGENSKSKQSMQRSKSRRGGMYSAPPNDEDDPASVAEEFRNALEGSITTKGDADRIFDSIDVDLSGTLDRSESSTYMLKAGLDQSQIDELFAAMDVNGDGEVSREEFSNAVLNKVIESTLRPKNDLNVKAAVPTSGDDVEKPLKVTAVSLSAGDV